MRSAIFSAVLILALTSLLACGGATTPLPVLGSVVGLPINAEPSSPSPSPSPTPNPGLASEEAAFLVLINDLRAQYGKRALQIDPSLQTAARLHSEYMNANDELTHSEPSPNTASWDRIENAGGSFNAMGENVACGNSTASGTFTQWKNSSGHLANMISGNYQYIGIARAGTTADARTHSCPWFWTTDFGGY